MSKTGIIHIYLTHIQVEMSNPYPTQIQWVWIWVRVVGTHRQLDIQGLIIFVHILEAGPQQRYIYILPAFSTVPPKYAYMIRAGPGLPVSLSANCNSSRLLDNRFV